MSVSSVSTHAPRPLAPLGEFLDLARLRDRASALAGRLRVDRWDATWGRGSRHLRTIRRQMRDLERVYQLVADDVHGGGAVSPSAEWLLDNFHLITNEASNIRRDLPTGYYRRLPRVSDPAGATRIEVLAREIIQLSDGTIDADRLHGYLVAFQSVSPLTIGELWAWPSALKLTLVGHIASVAGRILDVRDAHAQADARLAALDDPGRDTRSAILDSSSLPTIVRLVQRAKEYGAKAAHLREEIEAWFVAHDITSEEAIRLEGQRESAEQVSMANAVTSLRLCGTLDWLRFFESVSLVEQALQRDPSGVYSHMDFRTRDGYRRAVEEISGPSGEEQVRVALLSVERARHSSGDLRAEHVGYYLTGKGRPSFEAPLHSRRKWRRRIWRFCEDHATLLYLASLGMLTALLVAAAVVYAHRAVGSVAQLVAVALFVLVPASELATVVVQQALARWLPPRRLPRLDLERGVPEQGRTMVIVPTLFASASDVEELLAHIEVQALGNVDPRVHFAVLSDFTDADAERMPEDEAIVKAAREGVAALNRRHGDGRDDRFFLFHRVRRWNEREGRWIGWERKRGKIEEFCRLLHGATDTSYVEFVGDRSVLPAVTHCIVLDSDTRLPRDAAKALIGIALHPLNRPRIDSQSRLVVEGYGIIQPRVSVTMASAAGSLFARVYAGHTGVDPYTTAASDAYQDLFGEGIFTGKGLFNVEAFSRTLEGRVPENALLSHDLFEGIHARTALASDVEVVDDYPASVLAHARRQRRWVRGDWQILLWLFPLVPSRTGLERNPLSMISRWKILDNLRRSLVAPSLLALLIAGWTVLPGSAIAWTTAALAVLAAPLLALLPDALTLPLKRPLVVSARRFWEDVQTRAAQATLSLVLLAYHGWDMVHTIALTLTRLLVTQRRLLEWETAASATARAAGLIGRNGLQTFEIEMASSSLVSVAVLVLIRNAPIEVWLCAAPFVVSWLSAPAIAHWLSKPVTIAVREIDDADVAALRLWARRTWHYFETHVGANDHWLPPDNFQEQPYPVLARRTSPTNIGMSLLATLAAHDLGYVTTRELVARMRGTLDTIEALEGHEGHLFNWYATDSLAPLLPRYVSTVDSGNLVAALWTVAVGLDQIASQDTPARLIEGIIDTAKLLLAADGGDIAVEPDREAAQGSTLRVVARAILDGASTLQAGASRSVLHGWQQALERALADLRRAEDRESGDRPPESDLHAWATALHRQLGAMREPDGEAAKTEAELTSLARRCRALAEGMHFGFLYDRTRQLFAIGYRLADSDGPGRLDNSHYDLLASEARLASFVAIARSDVPQRHWFHLGRSAISVEGVPTLLSWSASMFEYLMPALVMRVFPETLLDVSCRSAVKRQMQYARRLGVPWGISESAFDVRDRHETYQYKAFGVPGLGLKRGLEDDLVIAPYASALAISFEPEASVRNLRRLASAGVAGRFGFYDAIDYTPRRKANDTAPSRAGVVVRTFMAHHQGMVLVALANALRSHVMVERFHADPRVAATELLLQERVPRHAAAEPPRPAEETRTTAPAQLLAPRRFRTAHTYYPHTQVLSNGSYIAGVTNAGGGWSRWRNLAVTRWREDAVGDGVGQAIYLRDVRSGDLWSATYQPTCCEADSYVVTFAADRIVFRRVDHQIDAQLEIAVSPEDDAEVRRLSLTNPSDRTREIEVTSYVELALCPQEDDVAHPAFAKLFIETEYLPDSSALICGRRRRTPEEPGAWLFHTMSVEGRTQGATEWETSRVKFIGRGRSLRDPACLDGRPLGGTVGTVLDPIVSLRQRVRLAPGGFVRISFATGAASDRAAVMLMAQKYHDRATASRIFGMARTSSQMHHRHLGVSEDVTRQFDRLASRVFSLDDSLRGNSETIARNTLGVSSLWGHGISGDLPIVLVFAALPEDLRLVQQVLEAQEYWRLQGLRADVVILSSHESGYLDEVHAELATLLEGGHWAAWKNRPGGVFLLRSEAVATEDRWALEATAKVVLVSGRGELVHHLDRPSPYPRPPAVVASHGPSAVTSPGPPIDLPRLMSNSLGGFSLDGREYVIVLRGDRETPAPWANVLANPEFGTIVTASGSSFTWSGNSRENRLTPWANDSVSDPTSETILVRDDDTMDVWGSTPGPLRRGPGDSWIVRHGFGTTRFERGAGDLRQTLDVFAAPADPVKLSILSLTNEKSSPRRLSVFGYVEWLLGAPRVGPPRHVVTSLDPETSALLAVNRFRDTWNDRIAFLWSGVPPRSFCGDRRDFIGRNGALDRARALVDNELSNRVGAGLDPCAALQVTLTLEPGETREIVFILGEGRSTAHVRDLIRRHGSSVLARRALAETRALWDGIIGAVQVRTPDDSFDLMVNGWLQYQNISARLWARTGFYQPGGAFGFRDQLQDVMALAYTRPDLYRRQILLAAEHQFIEGDVQHWWHPPLGQGTRTRCSDDLLWLPYAAAHYIAATGDRAVLDEKVPFINAPQLTPGQVDSYTRPTPAESGSLFEHCVRAINRGINLGAHGLPLIGSGDWNDGMNLVGREGRGESVWLGWFLYRVLSDFTPLAEARDEGELAARYRTEAQRLKGALELAWDGEWYRRAYFDDETPLGTVHADECQIDSVAQSWAVLSKAAPLRHAERAMDAVRSRLIRRDAQVILLLAPPFDRGTTEPGYIKAYPPGIRENGGQYTHAAVWTVMALTSLGYGDEGVELFHMLNPINHTRDANAIQRYAVEPYVVAADVYTHPQHTGRGGWTWYTASAGLMYRAAIESILGLKRHGRTFAMDPCIPAVWSDFHLDWRHGTSRYRVTVNNAARCSSGVALAQLDGAPVDHRSIPLVDDGQVHEVHIVMGLGAVRPQNGQ